MPLGFKDPGSLAAEVKMTRMVHHGALLVVEGISDSRFWQPRCHSTCELVDGEGKSNVVGCIRRLDDERFGGALGVVDDDYDSVLGVPLGSVNLVATSAHDLECMLFQSEAINTALAEFGVHRKVQNFEYSMGVDVRTALLERAVVVGRVRLAAVMFGLDIDVSDIRIPRFMDIDSWTIDETELIRVVGLRGSLNIEQIREYINRLPAVDPWIIARGHDMVEIFRIGLKRVLGNIKNSVGTEHICKVLRAAISLEELRRTSLWEDIRDWEDRNGGYPILMV